MKQLLVVSNLHSIVDVITNSSSELFVCRTKETIDVIISGLKSIVETYNKLNHTQKDFDDIFGEISVVDETNVEQITQNCVIDFGYVPHETGADRIKASYDFKSESVRKKYKYPYLDNLKYNQGVEMCFNLEYNKYLEKWKSKNYEKIKEWFIGKILIFSASDNSIPFELFDLIERAYCADKIHLG
jgi:hypothetical protein